MFGVAGQLALNVLLIICRAEKLMKEYAELKLELIVKSSSSSENSGISRQSSVDMPCVIANRGVLLTSVCIPNNRRVRLPSTCGTTKRLDSDSDLKHCCAVDVERRYPFERVEQRSNMCVHGQRALT